MFGLPVATIITLIPLIGALFVILTNKRNFLAIKSVPFWTTLFSFCFSIIVALSFDHSSATLVEELFLFQKGPIRYRVGIDKLSVLFVPVICFVCFICVLWAMKRKSTNQKTCFISILLFEALSIGAFYAFDLFLLFLLIESTIIPIYILMSSQRLRSSDAILHFLIYSMASAILILIAFIIIFLETKTTNLIAIYEMGVSSKTALLLLSLGIAIKIPIWPFYNWLPIVHVKAQTVCSVLLASIVLKFSSLLIIRVLNPLFLDIMQAYTPQILLLLCISMGFAVSQLINQNDLKAIFAYFSIIHLGSYFIMLLGDLKEPGFIFAIMYHSLLMPILFFASSIIETAFQTRELQKLKEIYKGNKELTVIMLFAFLCLISVPGSWGFISEILTIRSFAEISLPYTYIFTGLILASVIYVIHIYNSYFSFGKMLMESKSVTYTIDGFKKTALCSLFILIFVLGIYPKLILNLF